MSDENWERMTEVFAGARIRSADERESYLHEVCAGDPELHSEVKVLLAAHEQATSDNFLEPDDPMVGQKIGPYTIEKLLGDGGMGKVYLAVQNDPYMRVAIKIVKRGVATEQIIRQFHQEKRLNAAVGGHPNIAGLMTAGTTDDGQPYFVMEYVEGQRIDRYCDTRKLTVRDRIRLFRCVLDAVQHAHQNLVIHLDLNPSNILVTKDGVPKLVDFGIARLVNPDLGDHSGPPIGLDAFTPRCASPEQVRRDPIITTASDVYSLGVVLYELLTGHRPYELEDRSTQEIERIVCDEDPEKPSVVIRRDLTVHKQDGMKRTFTPEDVSKLRDCRPSRLRRLLAGDVDKVLLYALRKEPQRRFESVGEFSVALGDWLEWRPVQIPPRPTVLERFGLWCRRDPAVSALTAVVGLLVLLVAVVTMVGYYQITAALATTEAARQEAEDQRDKARTARQEAENQRDKARAALQQEDRFRQALLETPAFQVRKETVERVAEDPTFLELLAETIRETKELRKKLNDPRLDAVDKTDLKAQLQQHAARKKLQEWLKFRTQELKKQTEPIYNWFVLGPEGLFLAREPAKQAKHSSVGESFAWRTYFHGGPTDYKIHQDDLDNALGNPLSKPHLSTAFDSQSTGVALWAVSAPVLDEKGEFIGVVGLRVEIRQTPGASPAQP